MDAVGAALNDRDSPGDAALPLYETMYRVVRRHIEDGLLAPGLLIGEAALARAFGSSRVPAGVALRRLAEEGLISSSGGRGYVVGPDGGPLLRRDLVEAGRVVPAAAATDARLRHRARIYPVVEHLVAACLPYGRFQLNESLLADHYGVSRTVAHEVLTQLSILGLVVQDRNQRWYAGPLTPELMREHFEMRWLLEPIALEQAAPGLATRDLEARLDRIGAVRTGRWTPASLERLERDLHVDTVLQCANGQLRTVIRRSEVPLIATHDTFHRHNDRTEIAMMMDEHAEVFAHLLKGEARLAGRALEAHLRRSLVTTLRSLATLGPLPERRRMPFLVQVG